MRRTFDMNTPRPRSDGLKPLNESELYWNSQDVQDMVLREVNMDENSATNFSVDHDRLLMHYHEEFSDLCQATWQHGSRSLGKWAITAKKSDFLAFGQKIVDMATELPKRVIGFRVVRNTNRSSGYEVYSLQAIVEDVT
jgi:hypothetical protein